MSWDQLAGELSEPLLAALSLRAVKDGLPANQGDMAAYFLSHLERGIHQITRNPQTTLEAIIVLRGLARYSLAPEQTMANMALRRYEQCI